ncbi:hypothetical protein [Picosynechococcus sp. PCC 7117]|uniref:hypothetical protein n=1 Tax=Picosynechococcus sp. PCC 7117 TaxID=195498 RepID=UPI0012EEC19B|nr:hypothetical protein [Picosynechococcus sp. PCC 7117]
MTYRNFSYTPQSQRLNVNVTGLTETGFFADLYYQELVQMALDAVFEAHADEAGNLPEKWEDLYLDLGEMRVYARSDWDALQAESNQ